MSDEHITSSQSSTLNSAGYAEWHVIHGGIELGPLTLAGLVDKAVAGEVEPDDLVKQTGGLCSKAREFAFLRRQFLLKESRGEAYQLAPDRFWRNGIKVVCGGVLLVLVGWGAVWAITKLINPDEHFTPRPPTPEVSSKDHLFCLYT